MPTVRVRVPATSANLGPGFDALGLALNIYNRLTIESDAQGAGAPDDHLEGQSGQRRSEAMVTVTGEGAGSLTTGEDNIAVVAVRRLLSHLGLAGPGFRLHLENQIPLSRGLGSSAAARIGALCAANEWLRRLGHSPAGSQEILSLATSLEGHPDNAAAALLGGLVASTSVTADAQEDVASESDLALAVRMSTASFPRLLVFIPHTELSTATARGVLPEAVFRTDAVFNISRTALLLAALSTGRWQLLREALQDRLHQEHRSSLMPGLPSIIRAAREAGAYGATLSGAGPSVLAWLPDDAEIVAEAGQAMADAAAEHEVFGTVRETAMDLEGCVVEE